jgi:WD40 repeat protein
MRNAVTLRSTWLLVCAFGACLGSTRAAEQGDGPELRPPLSTLDVDFSPDGRLLAVASGGQGGGVVAWETSSWRVAFTHRTESGCCAIAFSADGGRLAFCEAGPAVGVLEVSSGKLLNRWEADTTRLYCVDYSSDGRILTAGADRTIKLWDPDSAELSRTWEGSTDVVYSAAMSGDCKTVISGGGDKTLRLWDEHGAVVSAFEPSDLIVRHVGLSEDGVYFYSSRFDARVRVQERESGRIRMEVRGGSRGSDLSRDQKFLATTGNGGAIALVFAAHLQPVTEEERRRIQQLLIDFDNDDPEVREAASRQVANIGLLAEPFLADALQSSSVEVKLRARYVRREILNPRPLAELPGHVGEVLTVRFSADSSLLATGCRSGSIRIWDCASWNLLGNLENPLLETQTPP